MRGYGYQFPLRPLPRTTTSPKVDFGPLRHSPTPSPPHQNFWIFEKFHSHPLSPPPGFGFLKNFTPTPSRRHQDFWIFETFTPLPPLTKSIGQSLLVAAGTVDAPFQRDSSRTLVSRKFICNRAAQTSSLSLFEFGRLPNKLKLQV